MEELSGIYKASVLALYSDGASYGAAQFAAFSQAQEGEAGKDKAARSGWIERELAAVRRSYDEEVRLLDGEVSELRAKLRQATSYISELRRRYEDSMKSIFRYELSSRFL